MRRLAFACCALSAAVCAQARVEGSIVLLSDNRFRGVSLSDGLPSAQIDVDASAPSGWYAGGFASVVRLAPYYRSGVQWLGYAGYARRIDARWSWDAGAAWTGFTREHEYDYAEVYAGLMSAPLSVRLHYTPHYFGQGPSVLYLEVDGVRELSPRWRLLGHIGVLHRDGGAAYYTSRDRYDVRLGAGLRLGDCDLQLAAVSGGGGAYYAFGYPAIVASPRNAVVASIARTW
ncbi:MAG: hypothetical protein JSS21_01110 [Proteobacteria bacterium]|nr:hypothetical protein [Pseudomonadota bacterium]